jgi:aspartyl-tRNA(Asn)/glutamyl-tRNA(Gln) amidotransferase subunit A
MDLSKLTIERVHEGLKNKEFSCKELTEAHLEQAKKENEKYNFMVTITEEEALEQAEKVDKKIAQGEELGILEGVPYCLKDIFCTKGVKTTFSANITKEFVPPYDATVVKMLKDEGAVLIGKTNMDEFACGASTEYSIHGASKNPVNPEYVTGGSSGGSAAAVATNSCVFALGTDTGGSIRQPASFCGIVGLKNTYGRVSRSGVNSMASSLDTIGPFTRNCKDAAYVLSKIAGQDHNDSTTPPEEVPNYVEKVGGDVKGLKIGVPKEFFDDKVDEEVAKACKDALAKLQDQGAELVEVDFPSIKYAIAVYYILCPAELSANLARFDGIRYGSKPETEGEGLVDYYFNARGEGFGEEIKRRIMIGTYVLSAGYYDAYYKKAQKVRTMIIEDFNRIFKKVDVMAGPSSPFPAFKLGAKSDDPLQMYLADALTIPINIAGVPSVNIPVGETEFLNCLANSHTILKMVLCVSAISADLMIIPIKPSLKEIIDTLFS